MFSVFPTARLRPSPFYESAVAEGMTAARPACRLYLITPPSIADLDVFADALEAALDAGDVAALQVRLKPATDLQIEQAVQAVLEQLQQRLGARLRA